MRISDLLSLNAIDVNAKASSKQEALRAAVALMVKTGVIKDEKAYFDAVLLFT